MDKNIEHNGFKNTIYLFYSPHINVALQDSKQNNGCLKQEAVVKRGHGRERGCHVAKEAAVEK